MIEYDAAKVSATLRNEVDLDQLREHLLTAVQETMEPSHVSRVPAQPDGSSLTPSRQTSP
jgi:hypothetical protein